MKVAPVPLPLSEAMDLFTVTRARTRALARRLAPRT